MKLRTINPVLKADAFGNKDCYVVARLVSLNIVTGIHQVVYELEIPYEPAPGAEIAFRIKPLVDFDSLVIDPAEINYVLGLMEVDLNAPIENGSGNLVHNFWQNIQVAVHEVFRQKVGRDGRFGLTVADWQII